MLIKLVNFKKQINNLYFDSNSIVYDCLRTIDKFYMNGLNSDEEFEEKLIKLVCDQLDLYILWTTIHNL